MKFWNCISEYLLFKWLFGSHKHAETKHDVTESSNSFDMDKNHDDFKYDLDVRFNDGINDDIDNFLDEQEEYDYLDDDF